MDEYEEDDYDCALSPEQELLVDILSAYPWTFGRFVRCATAQRIACDSGDGVNIFGTTAAGTGMVAITLPFPAPDAPVVVYEAILENGFFRLTYSVDQRLRAEVFEAGHPPKIVVQAASCPIVYLEQHTFKVAAAWSDTGVSMVINGTMVIATDADTHLPDSITIGKPKELIPEDFATRNAEAQMRRKGRAAGTHPVPGRIPRTIERDLLDLRRETQQINDLLILVRQGHTHHALGIARAVRKLLIGTSGRMGLLQRCAGRLDLPITMYTVAQPERDFLSEPGIELRVEFSGAPREETTNPVDVEVWMDLQGAYLADKCLTHREIIAAIGNTEAAHADAQLHPVVAMLERLKTSVSSAQMQDFLIYYVCCVGQAMARVAGRLLAHPSTTG